MNIIRHETCIDNVPELPSVAGRWRALGRKHIRAALSTDVERCDLAYGILVEHVANVLLACGVPLSGHRPMQAAVLQRFGSAFRDIVQLALEFQRIAGEEVVSRDLAVVLAQVGEAFDPKRMIDEWEDPKKPSSTATPAGSVLCSTQLGLVVERVAEGGAPLVDVVLLRPKVVLNTTLEELWKEQVPPGRAVPETTEAVVRAVDGMYAHSPQRCRP